MSCLISFVLASLSCEELEGSAMRCRNKAKQVQAKRDGVIIPQTYMFNQIISFSNTQYFSVLKALLVSTEVDLELCFMCPLGPLLYKCIISGC